MRSTTIRSLLMCIGAVVFNGSAVAQNSPAAPAISRSVLASTKLSAVVDVPLHFKAVRVMIPSREVSHVQANDGILYQLSGSTKVSMGNDSRILSPGEALYIGNDIPASLEAEDSGPSTFLHFLLAPAADLDRALEAPPAVVQELYRTVAPLPQLNPGRYDLNLSRVVFPAQMPSNPPHYRSGAALYYILSGSGTNTVEDISVNRTAGSLIYEPSGLVHQWGNPGEVPFTFLAFNINPEGVAAVLHAAPVK